MHINKKVPRPKNSGTFNLIWVMLAHHYFFLVVNQVAAFLVKGRITAGMRPGIKKSLLHFSIDNILVKVNIYLSKIFLKNMLLYISGK